MRRLLALMGLSLIASAPLYAAPVEINGGMEQFDWQEHDGGGNKLLKESGQRLFVGVEAENEVSNRWTYGFVGRIYSGNVDCNGQLKGGSSCSSNSDYNGVAITANFTGRFVGSDGDYSDLGLRVGIGGEAWRRHPNNIAVDYTESYVVAFGKLGLAYIPEQGLFGEAGAKYPLSVSEDVKLYDDVTLSPQGAFSLYASAGYNFHQRWVVKGYYDSYRFKASDPKPLYNSGALVGDVHQPESNMDTFGITVGFYF